MPIDPTTQMSDNALLAAFAKGHADAARLLSERLLPKAYAQAFFRLRNQADAEDIAQEAFIRLWRMAPNWAEDGTKVSTWLYKVVQHLCYDRLRRKPSTSLADIGEPKDSEPAAAEMLQDQTRANALYRALAELPDRQRDAVSMRHLDGMSNPEIAEIMELSVEAVESLISRGKRKLSDILQSH
ncbi:MAG: sigma-70 family RNA polymerase sigma factor, partial [Rhodobacteraceae bacterium]|nr:sigma-70 family RNA polymerase sigma factor [Paracoccaceae bacterium]